MKKIKIVSLTINIHKTPSTYIPSLQRPVRSSVLVRSSLLELSLKQIDVLTIETVIDRLCMDNYLFLNVSWM
jgi:hypothetical protein